jgi:hypothetical protein
VILDPEFNQKQDEQAIALNRAYNQTFDEFAKKNYTNTLICIMELKAQFGENKLSPQLAYLKTIAEGHQEELAPFETSLKNIVNTYPEDKLITPLVKNHLDFIEKNRKVLAAKLAVLTDKDPLVFDFVEKSKPDTVRLKSSENIEKKSKAIFELNNNTNYHVVINVEDGLLNLNSARYGINQFNRANFPESISQQLTSVGYFNQLINIGLFSTKQDAQNYANALKQVLPDIMKISQQAYSVFLITNDNLQKITTTELLTQYQKFYTENY